MEHEEISGPIPKDIVLGKNIINLKEPVEQEESAESILGILDKIRGSKDKLAMTLLITGSKPACLCF